MDEKELLQKAKEFENNEEEKTKIEKGLRELKELLEKFPFHEHPEKIDSLTPSTIYNPKADKSTEAFLYWVAYRSHDILGKKGGDDDALKKAKEDPDKFKQLLHIVVNNDLTIAQKIDANWEQISGWGTDKQMAKKIIFCYNQEKLLPVYSTDDLELFVDHLSLKLENKANELYKTSYKELTLGQKYEALNNLLLEYKNKTHFKEWQNIKFSDFLYSVFKPKDSEDSKEPNKLFNIINAINTKPFMILAGVSGTGKTQIARLVAGTLTNEEEAQNEQR